MDQTQKRLELEDQDLALKLTGAHSALLRELSRQSGATVSLRGNTLHIAGPEEEAELAYRFLEGAAKMTREGLEVGVADVAHTLRGLRANKLETLEGLLDEVIITGPGRRPIAPKTAGQKRYITSIRHSDLTFGIGPAGTGKTYLAMAMAASALIRRKVKRIVLTRPAVEAGERLGFLPGDLAEKVNPYLRPLYDALGDMLDYEKVQELRSRGQIEVAPLAFMRGRTLNDSFIILDEAQNATSDQMKMFLTRLGYGSQAVVTGDVTQTDLPRGARCGLREAQIILADVRGVAFHHFTDVDVVRHPLVQRIVVAYDKHEQARALALEPSPNARGEAPGPLSPEEQDSLAQAPLPRGQLSLGQATSVSLDSPMRWQATPAFEAPTSVSVAPAAPPDPLELAPETPAADIPETRASWAPPLGPRDGR